MKAHPDYGDVDVCINNIVAMNVAAMKFERIFADAIENTVLGLN